MKMLIRRYIADESGATAIEYAMLAGFIGLGIISAADALGFSIHAKLIGVNHNIRNAGAT